MAFDFSKLNLGKFVKIANGVSNPKKAIPMLLDAMDKKDPQRARMLRSMMSSNKSATQALRESASRGEITMEQLSDLKRGYSILSKLGLKHKIPESVWKEAESAIRGAKAAPPRNGGSRFSGF